MKKKGLNMEQKRSLTGWAFLLPAALLIFVFCFYPMVQALILSFQKGTGSAVQPAGFANYVRILKDATFQQCLFNTIFYFVIQVPIMLILALILAQLLNSPDIKGKGIYRTMIFLPCATSLVSYSMIFKSLFANDGLVNRVLSTVGIPTVDWFQNAWAARWVIGHALDALPERGRAALEMHFVGNMRIKAIAEVMHVSEATVKTHIKRALKALREGMKCFFSVFL